MSHVLVPNNELTESFSANMYWFAAIMGAAYRI